MIEYIFDKIITFEQIKEKTNLECVTSKTGEHYIKDDFDNWMIVYDSPDKNLILCRPLGRNPTIMMDQIVENFQTKFIDDERDEMIYHKLIDYDSAVKKCMDEFGYVIENNKIIVPKRN